MKLAWPVLAFALCGIFALALASRAIGQTDDDPAKLELDAAKADHTTAVNAGNSTMRDAFDAQIAMLKGDDDGIKVLSQQKSAFTSTGVLPASPLMKDAATQYKESEQAADDALFKAYSTAIAGFHRELKIDEASQARREQSDLLATMTGASIGGPQGSDISGAPPTLAEIAKQLEAAKTRRVQEIDDAKKALLAEIDDRVNVATDQGDLAKVEALQMARGAAAVDGNVGDVKDDQVIAAKSRFDRAIVAANTNLSLGYQKAVRDYTRARQLALAKSTQQEMNSLGLVAANAPSALTLGTYQLINKLPEFLTAKDSYFAAIPDHQGIVVPEGLYIRTQEGGVCPIIRA